MNYPSPADIAEMKARGDDPSAITEAEQRLERGLKAKQLCRVIEDAFAGVTLGNGIGLQQAQGLDNYADPETCALYRANDEKDDWHRISTEELNRCYSSPCFFDAEGMRFHLPAYLIADLQGEYNFGMDFTLTHLDDYSIGQFVLLSDKQREAVRAFLLHIAEEEDYEFGRPNILHALKEYWTAPPTSQTPTPPVRESARPRRRA